MEFRAHPVSDTSGSTREERDGRREDLNRRKGAHFLGSLLPQRATCSPLFGPYYTLLKFGLIPEFVGRLPVLATLTDLDEDALVTILSAPKNALVKQYQTLFSLENTNLTFTDEALKAIAKRAIARKTGARGLRSILEDILLNTMFELPGLKNVEEVVVNVESVVGESEPLIVYSDTAKKASAS